MTNDAPPRISPSLSDNRKRMEHIFAKCNDIVIAPFHFGDDFVHSALVIYCRTLTQKLDHNYLRSVFKDLLAEETGRAKTMTTTRKVVRFFEHRGPSSRIFTVLEDVNQVTKAILNGQFLIFFDSWDKALGFDAYDVERRQVKEPESESVIYGPREGMIEDLDKNVALLRVRLRTPQFKVEYHEAGEQTKSRFIVGYLDDSVDRKALEELNRRIAGVTKVELLDTSYIREFVEDEIYSPFPQYRITERPDVAVSAMLEGRIVMMAEGSGTILICPIVFTELFQSPEDYYQRTIISSMIRFLRVGAFFIALTLPSLYIALTTFHPELIPTTLLRTILDTREGIPFPAFLEALVMQFFFELLREAGIRLPRPIGSAVSIVGALIIGEASIRAGIASPIMIVVIALTGIASFSIPQYELATALRILVFPLMLLAYLWGGFGMMIAYILLFLHLTSLRSLGQPYLSPLAPLRFFQLLDVFVRAPLKLRMKAAVRQKAANKR